MDSAASRIYAPFFSSAFSWNFALGMTQLLIPLYARELGYSGVEIGSLIALPIVLQMIFNLIGGAWTDRLGGMNVSLVAFVATAAAGTMFAESSSFAGLFAAQIMMIVARAVYWPASWALVSQLPGARGSLMGTLNAITSFGQIAGTVGAGMIIAGWGFAAGFWTVAAMGVLSFASGLAFRYAPPSRGKALLPLLAGYRALLGRRSIYYGVMCAYLSALPFSLSVSFYPILLIEQGFGSEAAGWLVGMRPLGAIAAGVVLARFVKHADDSSVPLASALAVAASVGLVALFTNPAIIAFFLFGVGLGSGVMTIYFQILVSSLSSDETRGSAMALAGMGWSISHISTPLVMGALADLYGIHAAFYALGAFALLLSLALPPVHRWSLAGGEPR